VHAGHGDLPDGSDFDDGGEEEEEEMAGRKAQDFALGLFPAAF